MNGVPETRYTTAQDGSQIAFQVVGDGPLDLVYLTGALSHVDVRWEKLHIARFLGRMSSFSRLILFDRRGVGTSDRVPTDRLPSWEEWAEDLRVVLDASDSQRAALFAVVDGGPMAIAFAATYPDRTQALVLFNTTARHRIADDYPQGLQPDLLDFLISFREQAWGTEDAAAGGFPSAAGDPAELAWLAKYMRATSNPRASAAQYRAESKTDVRFVLPSVRAPTLVLHRRDLVGLPIAMGRYLADHIVGARFIELSGSDGGPQLEDADLILTELEEFLTGIRPPSPVDRFLSTVLFTDIVDSTRLSSALGDRAWHARLDDHDQMVRRELKRFRGREIKTMGDGFLATFDGPGRAIECCRAIRDGARRHGIQVRLGLHTGEVEARGDDIGGITVNIASRVAAWAGPGEVLVSRTVTDLVAGSVIAFEDRGEHDLKGVPGSWKLFAVKE
jgi:class 3 adenylate cyclase